MQVGQNAVNSTAIGRNANIGDADNAIAIGGGIDPTNAAQVGAGANNAIAIGVQSDADGVTSVAIGDDANGFGSEGIAVGHASNVDAGASEAIAIGDQADTDGARAVGLGHGTEADGTESIAVGDNAEALGDQSIAMGNDASATGTGSIAIGDGAVATGSIAMGQSATASNGGTAIGDNTSAAFSNSAAWGVGATATRANQQVFGTANNTYTMAGITSDASRNVQSGPLEVVTSDGAGNLATDGGQIFKGQSQNQAGVATAIALENPTLHGDQVFAIAGNVGFFEDSTALGFTAIGQVSDNLLGMGEQIALSGGIAFSVDETSFGGRTEDALGGRVGLEVG